jgi:hypothetical protein
MNKLKQYLNNLPDYLVKSLQTEFQKLHKQYFLGHWEPGQLDGGRFAEITLRIVELKNTGNFTPIDTQLNRLTIIRSAEQNTSLPYSLRFQIPRISGLILDFRNNRNVGHVGNIDVNEMDSTFILHSANWIVSELIRLETNMSPVEAQKEIKKIIERKVPLIEELGGRLKILNSKLNINEKILVICYQKFPSWISDKNILDWTEYNTHNSGRFYQYLTELSKDSFIDFRNNKAILTSKGLRWVEKNIKFDLEI